MMRFDSSEIGQTMSEIVAYGTAAVIEPLPAVGPHGLALAAASGAWPSGSKVNGAVGLTALAQHIVVVAGSRLDREACGLPHGPLDCSPPSPGTPVEAHYRIQARGLDNNRLVGRSRTPPAGERP